MIRLLTIFSTFLVFGIGSAYADQKKVGFIYIGPPKIIAKNLILITLYPNA